MYIMLYYDHRLLLTTGSIKIQREYYVQRMCASNLYFVFYVFMRVIEYVVTRKGYSRGATVNRTWLSL